MDNEKVTVDIPDHVWQVFYFMCSWGMSTGLDCERYDPIVCLSPEKLWINSPARIDSFCKLECGEGMYIGKNVHIASFCHLGIGGGLLILEQGSSCASGVKIITGSNLAGPGHGCSAIDPKAIIKRSFVHVKRNATLYTGSIVCPGVTIGEGAVVLPGAVVNCDVPDGETWGGVPVRKIKGRTSPISNVVSVGDDLISKTAFDKVYPLEDFGSDSNRSFASDVTVEFLPEEKSVTNLNCIYCGAPYFAHEIDAGNGLRAHQIDNPSQPQHGQLHFYIPNTGKVSKIFFEALTVSNAREWVGSKLSTSGKQSHVVHSCCGCSCHVCENGHATQPAFHTEECKKRFWAEVEEVKTKNVSDNDKHTPDRWVSAQEELYRWD